MSSTDKKRNVSVRLPDELIWRVRQEAATHRLKIYDFYAQVIEAGLKALAKGKK